MKTYMRILALAVVAGLAAFAPAQDIKVDDGIVMVPVDKMPRPVPPLFFSAHVEVKVMPGLVALAEEIKVAVRVHQGKP